MKNNSDDGLQKSNAYVCTYTYIYIYIWVVVKIMVPFWVPSILGAVLFWGPKKGP